VASAYTSGMKKSLRIPLILLFVGVVLAGCGNKGDLVLPDPPEPTTAETQPEP
jgi:predicted small lipoprotein YifL